MNFKSIVSIAAAVAAGAILLWAPFTLVTGTIVAALVILSLLGGIKTMLGTLYGAPSVAAVLIVVAVCITIVKMASISASAPVRISQEDYDKAKAVALVAGKALAAIDLQNAIVARDAALREAKVLTAQRNGAEEKWQQWQMYGQTKEQELGQWKKAYADLKLVSDANAVIVMQTRPDIRERAERSMRGENPEPEWRSYVEDRLLIASAFVRGTVRADCSMPAQSRAIEFSRDGRNWQPLRDAEYKHRAVEHGVLACS